MLTLLRNLGFLCFEKKKIAMLLNFISRITLYIFTVLTKAKLCLLFLLFSTQVSVELSVGVKRPACSTYVAESKAGSKKKQVIESDQVVQVCEYIYIYISIFFLNELPLSQTSSPTFLL